MALRAAASPASRAAEIERRVERRGRRSCGSSTYLERKPRQLSGGQRQRVAIGRAIVREPKVFLFDEPLSNLDAALRVAMRIEIAELQQRLGTTMIYVTHDQVEAMTLADRIVVLNDGRIEQVGTPLELYNAPANLFVAGFIGSPKMNFLDRRGERGAGRARRAEGRRRRVHGPYGAPQGPKVEIGIRPEHWTLGAADQPGSLPGTVVMTEQLGSDTYVYVTTPAGAGPASGADRRGNGGAPRRDRGPDRPARVWSTSSKWTAQRWPPPRRADLSTAA